MLLIFTRLSALVLAVGLMQQAPAHAENISFDAFSSVDSIDEGSLENENVAGADIMIDWADVEKADGVFDFAEVDKKMEAWASAGKKFVIAIRYLNQKPMTTKINYCNPSVQHIPTWLVNRLPKDQYFCDAAFGNIIPNYFNGLFRSRLKRFVLKVGTHVASKGYAKNVLYVRGGVGIGSEGFYITPCNLKDEGTTNQYGKPVCDMTTGMQFLKGWGLTSRRWKWFQIYMLRVYRDAFPHTTIIYPVNNLGNDGTLVSPVQVEVADWVAQQKKFGLGAQGLSDRFPDGAALIGPIFDRAKAANPKVVIQLQTVGKVINGCDVARPLAGCCDAKRMKANEFRMCIRSKLKETMNVAGQLKADHVEWYTEDLQTDYLQDIFRDFVATPAK